MCKIESLAFGSYFHMSYPKTEATSDVKILTIILSPYGHSEHAKNQGVIFEAGMLPDKHSQWARGTPLKSVIHAKIH